MSQDLRVGVDGTETIQGRGLRPGPPLRQRTSVTIPAGICHAVPLDGNTAQCGHQSAELTQQTWASVQNARVQRCPECVRRASV
jgi:hypothetical protein